MLKSVQFRVSSKDQEHFRLCDRVKFELPFNILHVFCKELEVYIGDLLFGAKLFNLNSQNRGIGVKNAEGKRDSCKSQLRVACEMMLVDSL